MLNLIQKLWPIKRKRRHQYKVPEHTRVSADKHPLQPTNISGNALKVLQRLQDNGHQAFIVGGGVRDLFLGHDPKDFDIATDAHPQAIKALFKNARIIGRRFKLVHVQFRRELIEVATFRQAATQSDDSHRKSQNGFVLRDNCFGNIEQDVWRRDLTINALYYDQQHNQVIDFVGGVNDLSKKIIRIIGDVDQRYREDPVRMLRVIRFAAKLNFTVDELTLSAIHQQGALIKDVAHSRLFEEITKLYHCGNAYQAHTMLVESGLFKHLFPHCANPNADLIQHMLKNTDQRISEGKSLNPGFYLATLFWPNVSQHISDIMAEKRRVPIQMALEEATASVLEDQSCPFIIPKRFSQTMRDIWMMQFRLPRRQGARAFKILTHPRFRAGYDFLALRALTREVDQALVDWWTDFQSVNDEAKRDMVKQLRPVKQ